MTTATLPAPTDLSPPPLLNDRLLRACRRESVDRPPVWMMRQAGRYLPEYRAVRAGSDFLSMVRTPELAAEVTLQPIDILNVDAAIIFSDILVVPSAMGMTLRVDDGVGPRFDEPLRSPGDLAKLRSVEPEDDLRYTLDAIRLVRRELNGRVPVIGFAGAPWTLAAYMIEGGGSPNFQHAKRAMLGEPKFLHTLLERLAVEVGAFLCAQVAAGAQVIQLFDSWAGALTPEDYREFALPALALAAEIARTSGAPLIVFPHGASWAIEEVALATKADVIGVDWRIHPAEARRLADKLNIAVQGNLDPCVLYGPPDVIRARTNAMLRDFAGDGHIANLGHGIFLDVPVENARTFIDTVREWRPA
ncbi:MAG: uroporphyrinogen decarboxylase [Phycisphaerae bacterium]|nr:uroporphyrinogen decarboxylase [Gemmatimonadaceae bacterium]